MGLAGLGSQTRPCLRLTFAILGVTIMSMFYFSNDLSNITYSEYIRNLSNDYAFFESINVSFQQDINLSFNTSVREGYLVWGSGCRIPDINPYHESIRHLIKKVKIVQCSNLPPLTHLSNNQLVYNESIASKYAKKLSMVCCYQKIERPSTDHKSYSSPDDVIDMSPCKRINQTITLKDDEEFIMVKCNVPKKKGSKEVYGNMHARIINKTSVDVKLKKNLLESTDDRLSILFFGIDSISRLNIQRTMPNTVSFLKEHDFIELAGYNKIDDNTFPNLVAILTGMTVNQLRNRCWKTRAESEDKCPFLWKNASDSGYVTMYAEDEPEMGSFNYHKKGFRKQPTDYYFRPYMLAANKYLKFKILDSLKICLGPQLTTDILMDYTRDFLRYIKKNLYFSLTWMNNFSHNNVNTPSCMDNKMLQFFQDVFKLNETLNTSMIIFISDHGMRFGEIRKTYVGWLEERLPFIYIWLPEWYRKKYQEKYNNILTNMNRLTTPYDMHMTIREVTSTKNNMNSKTGYTCEATSNCLSLFQEIPWNRSCNNAGINEHWCTCSEYKTLSTEGVLVRAMVHFAVNEINALLETTKNMTGNATKCAKLGVKRVLTVRSVLYDKPVGHNDYIVIFETLPGAALFETTIRHESSFKIMDSISRINAYHSQSHCVPDAFLKKYCFCTRT